MNANAEIIAELRRVLNERDEAREQLDLTKRELGRWVDRETKAVREHDEARAEVERLRETIKLMWSSCGCCKCTACSLAKQAIHPKKAKAK